MIHLIFTLLSAVAFAAGPTLSGVKLKEGRYTNGTCVVTVDKYPDGSHTIRVQSNIQGKAGECGADKTKDCGALQAAFDLGVKPDGSVFERALYPRGIEMKQPVLNRKADGSLSTTFEMKEAKFITGRVLHHSQMSLDFSATGDIQSVKAFWDSRNSPDAAAVPTTRIANRCNDLKFEAAAKPGGAEPAPDTEGAVDR